MMERPILFHGDLVREILAGTKRVTRRPVNPQPEPIPDDHRERYKIEATHWWPSNQSRSMVEVAEMSSLGPFGVPGDRLYVRETWTPYYGGDVGGSVGEVEPAGSAGITYRADGARVRFDTIERLNLKGHSVLAGAENTHARWRPSLHMPRWASRILLEVVNVHVEQLQSITSDDARREGIKPEYRHGASAHAVDYIGPFRAKWNAIYGKNPLLSWAANPWIWRVEFKRIPETYQRARVLLNGVELAEVIFR